MASDEELVSALRDFLRSSDLSTTTTAIVRRRLEQQFSMDLTGRKSFIREQVDFFLQSGELGNDQNDDNVPEHEEEEEDSKENEEGEEDEEEEEEEDEEDVAETTRSTRKRRLKRQNKEGKKRGGGVMKLSSLSPQLQEIVGVSESPRTEVVKKIWAYIREKNLQDPNNKKRIVCDDGLRSLFNIDSIDMFQMNKALSKHIWPSTSEDGQLKKVTREKQPKKEKEEDSDEQPQKEKRKRGGFLAPLLLSDALVKFLGTGESTLPRAAVVKRMWDYIKQNSLQDPNDKRKVMCDEKLKELFNVESFHGFSVTRLLTDHLMKKER